MNAKLKRLMDYKPSSLVCFLDSMSSFYSCEEGKAIDGYTMRSCVYRPSKMFNEVFPGPGWSDASSAERVALLKD